MTWLGGWWSVPFWLLALFILQFFRDPPREVPADPGAVLSAADGRVVEVSRAQDPYVKRDALKVSVFMNVFNVHSNRSPVDGTVKERWYFPGAFVNAALDKASLDNERNALWLRTPAGHDVTCVQVAGLIARRILCYVGAGAQLERGQRFGFIRFGSRVDLYLPLDAEVKAALGDKVYASETVLAWLKPRRRTGRRSRPDAARRRRRRARDLRRRGIYLLPNLFTTGVLFCGFFAIVQAMNGRFEVGCIAIFVAMVLDGMDGRVARWTNTQSEFGAQYDSHRRHGRLRRRAGADRLHLGAEGPRHRGLDRRLHLLRRRRDPPRALQHQHRVVDKRYFQGLPSPSGAAVMAGFIWVLVDFGHRAATSSTWLAALTWVVAVFAGVTMVSNVPFWSFKEVNWKQRVPLWVILAAVVGFSVVASQPVAGAVRPVHRLRLSGYVLWAMGHRARPILPDDDSDG